MLSDEFMTKLVLDSIDVYDVFIFVDHFHLKMNLKKSLLSKSKILKPYIGLMFTASDEEESIYIYEEVINMCKVNKSSVMIIIKLIEKNFIGFHIQLIKLKLLWVSMDHLIQNLIILVLNTQMVCMVQYQS